MKRKVLISVLAIALVLTLCLGIFAACDPKEDDTSKKTEYTVTYSLGEYDGTSAAPAAQKVEDGSKATLPEVGVTWEGHNFTGWKAGEGELLQPGTEVEVKADITYIAQWEGTSETPKAPKVTIYYTLGTELKSVLADVMEAEEGKYTLLQEPYFYVPDEEYDQYAAQVGYAQVYAYYYYDAEAADHKGAAFDYSQSFEYKEGLGIIICIESIGTPAAATDLATWTGNYKAEGPRGAFTLSILSNGMATLTLNAESPINASVANETIYKTSDGKIIIIEKNEYDWDEDGEIDSTYCNYYYFTKNQDGSLSMESDIISAEFQKVEDLTIKVYYPIDAEGTLHFYEATSMFDTSDGTLYMDEPYYGVPEENGDWDALDALRTKGKVFGYYYYSDTATDHKGETFDYNNFEAEENFSVLIAIDPIGTEAYLIKEEWYGYYTATNRFGGEDFTLEINGEDGGTIIFDVTGGENPISESINEGMSANDPMIYTSADGSQLILIEEWGGGYNYYYFTKNEDGSITVSSDGASFEFSPAEKPEEPGDTKVTVTIHYTVDGEAKTYVVDGEAVAGQEGVYKLSDTPVLYLPDDDYEAVTGSCDYGQNLAYYYYDAEAADFKGAAFDYTSATFDKSIEVIITVETFATPADSIDAKFEGSYAGTLNGRAFILTIDATAKTINVDYGTALNPINASVEDGTIFTTADGKLVFVEGSVQFAHYYYLTEKDGALTLDCEYSEEPIALVASLKNLAGIYKNGQNTLLVTTYAAGEYIEFYDFTASGSVIYNGELIKVSYVLYEGKWYIQGYQSEYEGEGEESYPKFFSATVSDDTITIGETAFTGRTDIVEAEMSDFAGYYRQSDSNRYWSIKATQNEDFEDILVVKYGDTNPQEANYDIIGDYIYLTYTSLGSTYAYLLQKGENDALTGTYIAPEKAPAAVTFAVTDRYADKTNTYTYTPAEGETLDVEVNAFGGTATLKITSILLNSFTEPTYAELVMAVDDGAATTYYYWLEDEALFNKLRLLDAEKYTKDGYNVYTMQDVTGLRAHDFAIVLVGEGKIEIYHTSTYAKLGELTNKDYEEPEQPEPTGPVTYEGEVSWTTGSGIVSFSYKVTKVVIDPSKEVTTAEVTYSYNNKEKTETITLEKGTANDWTGEYAGHTLKYYYQYEAYGSLNCRFAIYDDGALFIGNNQDAPVGRLYREGEVSEEPQEEEIQITVKAGEGCADASWSKQITIMTGKHDLSDITKLLGGADKLPAGENRYWYFAGYTIKGENILYTSSANITKDITEITLYYKDGTWRQGDLFGIYIDAEHFGEEEGTLELNDSETDKYYTLSYKYSLTDEGGTITLTYEGTTFEGTLETTAELGRTLAYGTFELNITITIGEKTYTFGKGSTGGGTTEPSEDPYAGTTWEGKDFTLTFSADGKVEAQYQGNWKVTGSYTYDAEKGFTFTGLNVVGAYYDDPRLTITVEGSSLSLSITLYEEGDFTLTGTLTKA